MADMDTLICRIGQVDFYFRSMDRDQMSLLPADVALSGDFHYRGSCQQMLY